jgi:hypothetical protein
MATAPCPSTRNYIVKPFNLILCSLLLSLVALVTPMKVSKETFEVALVFGCGFVVLLLELRVADIGFAVLAPVFRL